MKKIKVKTTTLATPDYTGDAYWANVLRTKLEQFYTKKGHTDLDFKVIDRTPKGGIKKVYGISSNIIHTCPD